MKLGHNDQIVVGINIWDINKYKFTLDSKVTGEALGPLVQIKVYNPFSIHQAWYTVEPRALQNIFSPQLQSLQLNQLDILSSLGHPSFRYVFNFRRSGA